MDQDQAVAPWDNENQGSPDQANDSVPEMVDSDPFSATAVAPGSPLDYPYADAPQQLPAGTLPPPQQGFAPPGAPMPPQQGFAPPGAPPPPGGGYAPPPGTWGGPPNTQSASAGESKSNKTGIVLALVAAIGILILGGSVFAYLTFLRPATSLDDVSAMLNKYLNAAIKGDSDTVASLHAPDTQPAASDLANISFYKGLDGIAKMNYSDVQVKEVKSTSNEMEVEFVDVKMTIEASGIKESMTLKELKEIPGFVAGETIKLKKVDGKWLIGQSGIVDPFAMQIDSSFTVPSSGSS